MFENRPGSATLAFGCQDAAALVSRWLNRRVTCHEITPLTGGICAQVYRLDFDCHPHRAVVKLLPRGAEDPFSPEARALHYLREHTRVPCPEVYLQDTSGSLLPHQFLLLEHFDGLHLEAAQLTPSQRAPVERELAEVLLELHSHTRDTFGSLDEPEGAKDWRDLFLPDLEESREDMAVLAPELLADLDLVLPIAKEALREQGPPALIHNDLWSGNIMVVEREDGWHLNGLLDPVGLKFAEVEKELAYLQAFDTVGPEFFRVYEDKHPLRPGFDFRKRFYWLETYMVEIWLGLRVEEMKERIAQTCKEILATAPDSDPR